MKEQRIKFWLEFDKESGDFIVDCPELDVYGVGKTIEEAIKDFFIALKESYWSLKEDEDKLSPNLKKKWEILKKVVEGN